MRCKIESLRITADSTQAPEHPMYFNYIKLTFRISGENIDERKVQRAIDLSMTKYCSVKASMTDKCRFETEIVIE
jgi:putative redox protein